MRKNRSLRASRSAEEGANGRLANIGRQIAIKFYCG